MDSFDPVGELQPQWVSRSKLNLRLRNFARRKTPAVTATMTSDAILCQSIYVT